MGTSIREAAGKGLKVFSGQEWWVKLLGIIAAIAVVTLLGIYVLPSITLAFENIAVAAVWGGVLLTAFLFVTNDWVQTTYFYAIDRLALLLRDGFIKSDPVRTAQVAFARLRAKIDEIRKSWGSICGDRKQLEAERVEFMNQRDEAKASAKLAYQEKDLENAEAYATTVTTLEESISQLEEMLKTDVAMESSLERLAKCLETKLAKEQRNFDIKLHLYNISQNNARATRAARAALGGKDREMLDLSVKKISDNTYQLIGEADTFMQSIQPMLNASSFEERAKAMQSMEMLKGWIDNDSSVLPSAEKHQLLLEAGATQFLPAQQTVTLSPVGDEYQLINRK